MLPAAGDCLDECQPMRVADSRVRMQEDTIDPTEHRCVDRDPEERAAAVEYYERTARASIQKFWNGSKPDAQAAHLARAAKTAASGRTTTQPRGLIEENTALDR